MYLSQLKLNPTRRLARHDLASPYEMHRTLWKAFPDRDPGRVLFRLDADRRGQWPTVLVQSDFEPDWSRLPTDDYLAEAPQAKPFAPSLAIGQKLRFRLRANPTKKTGGASKTERLAGQRANGRRVALLNENDQLAWLLHKGEEGGFRVPGVWIEDGDRRAANFRVDAIPEGWVRCAKEGHREGRFFAVRFEGLLEVVDADLFRSTVENGIGSAKGFGFGLLSVAPY